VLLFRRLETERRRRRGPTRVGNHERREDIGDRRGDFRRDSPVHPFWSSDVQGPWNRLQQDR